MIADLHVHSHLSRATSKQCNLEGLHEYAQRKGVMVVGTGDFTHPEWFAEIEEKLEPSAPGLFRLKPELAAEVDTRVPASCRAPVHFMLTGEISSIYKRDGSCRKVHSLLLAPSLDSVREINRRLDALGNIKSDGRPILGLDPRILLEIALEASPDTVMIPAHIWTPWFSTPAESLSPGSHPIARAAGSTVGASLSELSVLSDAPSLSPQHRISWPP